MQCNQSRPGLELVSPCSFPTMITITPRAPHKGILNTCTQLWLTESEQVTPVDSIKDVVWSSVKVPEFDKHLKTARGHVGRNVVEITVKMKTIVQKSLMIKIFYELFNYATGILIEVINVKTRNKTAFWAQPLLHRHLDLAVFVLNCFWCSLIWRQFRMDYGFV